MAGRRVWERDGFREDMSGVVTGNTGVPVVVKDESFLMGFSRLLTVRWISK